MWIITIYRSMDTELESTQEAKVEMNVDSVDEREEIKLEALQLLKQGWGAMNCVVVKRCQQLMVVF